MITSRSVLDILMITLSEKTKFQALGTLGFTLDSNKVDLLHLRKALIKLALDTKVRGPKIYNINIA